MTVLALWTLPARSSSADGTVRLPSVTVQGAPLDLYLPSTATASRDEMTDSRKTDVTQVLDLLPGVNVRTGGRAEPRVDIRGFDQRATLLTLDDVPVFEPWNGIINLDLFPLEMLGGLSVVRGPASAVYGPSGMAGTIKLRTFLPEGALVGNAGQMWRDSKDWDTRASAGIAGPLGSAILGGRYLSSDGFPLSGDFTDRPPSRRRQEGGGRRNDSDRAVKSLFGSGTYRLSESTTLRGTVLASRSEFGVPLTTTQFRPVLRRTDPQDLVHVQAAVDSRISARLKASGAVFSSMYRLDDRQFLERTVTTRAESDEVGGLGRLSIDFSDRNTLTTGALVRHGWADVRDSEQGLLVRPDFTMVSVVAEDVHFPLPQLALVAGLSVDAQGGRGAPMRWEANPQGGLYYDFGTWGSTRAALSRKTRFPTLRELYDPVQGEPGLSPETAFIAEVGHQARYRWLNAGAGLFRNDVRGLIETESGGNESRNTNLSDAIQQGVEITLGASPSAALRVDTNYTWLDATAHSGPGSPRAPLQHRPAHRFNGILQAALPGELRLRLEGLYTSEQVEQFGSTVRLPGFALFQASVARAVGPWAELYAGCDNLLDVDYEERLGTPQPGRWFYFGMRARIEREMPG